ncbi:hypothetical protein E1J38_007285 [Seonamhaeicola sediminis]|uniref:DUF5050 domain-containing protein n=1 Tax=Seonamhaeicola sediminis TaxID=2528206 RepID=A0A562YEF0_9FLAO|nr:PD40 domain-containing protein [Seonamhaeicola sediminis]TWO32662.1 hypothetical protein E1J38_007285 [Seonamhaeicola sediminis]
MKPIISSILALLVFLSVSNEIISQEDLLGYKEVQLTQTNADNRYASYNHKGEDIIFESNRDGRWQIYIMDINGTHQKPLFKSSSNDRRPSWHPYKDIVIFESDRSGTWEIYTYDFENNSVKKMRIPIKGDKRYARFAPNGVQVVFCHEAYAGVTDIYMCSNKGKRTKRIVNNKHLNIGPHFNRRGDYIIYHSNRNTQGESNIIYSRSIITDDRNRLTYFKDHSEYPNWSNIRSTRIVYSAKVDDMIHPEIFIMRSNGTRKIQVTYNDVPDILPSWSPNDINLLITGYRDGYEQICKILLKEPLNPENRALDQK